MIESNPINVDAKKAFGFGPRLDIRLGFAFFGRQVRGFLATRSTSFEHKDLSEHWSPVSLLYEKLVSLV